MNVTLPPGFAAFRSAYDAGRGSLVWRRGVADLETPVAAFLKLAHGRPNSFLLESVEGGAARGRYSIIGMEPDLVWRCRDGRAEVNRHALSAPHAFVADPRPALDSLRALIAETRLDVPASLPPMAGGLVGYLGYDMVRLMEKLPEKNRDEIGVPDALMLRPTLFAIFDNVNDELTLAAPVYPSPETAAERRLGGGAGAPGRGRGRAGAPAAASGAAGDAARPAGAGLDVQQGGVPGGGAALQGLHRRRRRVPDRHRPALLHPVRAAAVLAVSRAAADQSGAVPVLPRFRRLRRGGVQSGGAGAAARWAW